MKQFTFYATNTMELKVVIKAETLEEAEKIVDELIVDDFEPQNAVFTLHPDVDVEEAE